MIFTAAGFRWTDQRGCVVESSHSIRVHSTPRIWDFRERIGFIAVHPASPNGKPSVRLVLANRILGFVNAPARCSRFCHRWVRQPWIFQSASAWPFLWNAHRFGFGGASQGVLSVSQPGSRWCSSCAGLHRKGSSWYQGRVSAGLDISRSRSAVVGDIERSRPGFEKRGPLWSQKWNLGIFSRGLNVTPTDPWPERRFIWSEKQSAMKEFRMPGCFSGMAHIGKYKTAIALAQTLNCLENGATPADIVIFAVRSSMSISRISGWSGLREKISGLPRSGMRWTGCICVLTGRNTGVDFWGCRSVQSWIRQCISENPEEPPPDTLIILINLNPRISWRRLFLAASISASSARGDGAWDFRAETELSGPTRASGFLRCWRGPQWSCIAGGAHADIQVRWSVPWRTSQLSAWSRCFREPTIGPNQKMRNGGWFWICWKTGSGSAGLSIIFRSRICFMLKKQELEQCSKRFASRMFTSSVKIWPKQKKHWTQCQPDFSLESLWIRLKHYSTVWIALFCCYSWRFF